MHMYRIVSYSGDRRKIACPDTGKKSCRTSRFDLQLQLQLQVQIDVSHYSTLHDVVQVSRISIDRETPRAGGGETSGTGTLAIEMRGDTISPSLMYVF